MTTSVVVGAGIVGLHVANQLQEKGHEVFVLDSAPYLADHTSGRNSGVIHAGIFYTPNSFKEQICVRGNQLTYDWMNKLNVAHKACGKWVVPELGQEDELDNFFNKINAIDGVSPQLVTAAQIQKEDPNLRALDGLFIPSTGILDAAEYVTKLSAYIENKGVQVILNCKVTGIKENVLETSRGEIPFDLAINSAGLFCDEIARMNSLSNFEIKPCRGDYYLINKAVVSRPVYHLPYKDAKGLGVHLTPTTDGQTLIGPNAFFIEEKLDYDHKSDEDAFAKSFAYYLPNLPLPQLQKAYSGNRPKLYKDGEPLKEFTIEKQGSWIHLLGIESPGLTSAPALAEHVLTLL